MSLKDKSSRKTVADYFAGGRKKRVVKIYSADNQEYTQTKNQEGDDFFDIDPWAETENAGGKG